MYILLAVLWLGCIAGPVSTSKMHHFIALSAICAWHTAFPIPPCICIFERCRAEYLIWQSMYKHNVSQSCKAPLISPLWHSSVHSFAWCIDMSLYRDDGKCYKNNFISVIDCCIGPVHCSFHSCGKYHNIIYVKWYL